MKEPLVHVCPESSRNEAYLLTSPCWLCQVRETNEADTWRGAGAGGPSEDGGEGGGAEISSVEPQYKQI